MAKTTRLAASNISGTNGLGFDFEIKSDFGSLTTSDSQHEITILPAGGLVFDFDSGDMFEPFDPIVSSSVALSFFATHDDQLTDIVSMNRGGEKATYIKIKMWKSVTQNQYWYGIIVPEETRYEVTDGRTLVTMRFADGIRMLDSEEFSNYNGSAISGWMTCLDAVNRILRKIPWVDEELSGVDNMMQETPFLDLEDWTDNAGYTDSKAGMLRRTGFIGTTYLKDEGKSEDGRAKAFDISESSLKVLRDICVNFGYKVCWNGEFFHFFSPLNYTDDAQGQSAHKSLEYKRDQAGNQQGDSELFQASTDMDNTTKILSGAYRLFSSAYNEAIIQHEGSISSNIIGPQSGLNMEGTSSNSNFAAQDGQRKFIANYRIDNGQQLSFRIAGTLNLRDNPDHGGYQWFAKCKIKVGSYYLSGNATVSIKDLSNNSQNNYKPCLDKDQSNMHWTTSESYFYVPYITGYSYATPTADEHLDGAQFLPSLFVHDGTGGYNYSAAKKNIKIDFSLVTPEIPVNSVGITFDQGLEAKKYLNLSYVTYKDSYDSHDGSDFFTGESVDYFNQTCFLYEGEQQNDPIYSTKNSNDTFVEVLELKSTRLAARLNRDGNAGYLSTQKYDGTYTFDDKYVNAITHLSAQTNNLGHLLDEWYRLAGTGMEGLECEFVFNNGTGPHFINWPDKAIKTTEVIGGSSAAYFLPSTMSYDVSGPLSFTGLMVDRDAGVSIVDNDKEEQGTSTPITATIDGRVSATGGGGGVSAGDLQDSKDDTDLLAIFISRN